MSALTFLTPFSSQISNLQHNIAYIAHAEKKRQQAYIKAYFLFDADMVHDINKI